jgi:signal transduction histidine kinase
MWVVTYALFSEQYNLKPRPIVLWAILFSLVGGFAAMVYQTQLYVEGIYLPFQQQMKSLCIGATFGGATGSLAGYYRSRTTAHLDEVKVQRDGFKFLNSALRHNILNGINIIDGYADALAAKEDPDQSRELAVIQERSKSIASLIDNAETLTEFYSKEVDLQKVDLSEIVRKEAVLAQESFEEASITADIEADTHIEGTPVLRAAFDNLITNAVEHNESREPEVAIELNKQDAFAEVLIIDDGPGISQEEFVSNLEPGNHTEEMGLSIVDKIVQQVNGTVEVVDSDTEGANIRVKFPLAERDDAIEQESTLSDNLRLFAPTTPTVGTEKTGIFTRFKRFL